VVVVYLDRLRAFAAIAHRRGDRLARKGAQRSDPSYAPAAAMVGFCRGLQRLQGWGALSDEDIGEACRLARQALEAERNDANTFSEAKRNSPAPN